MQESPPTDVIEVKTGLGNSGKTAHAKVDIQLQQVDPESKKADKHRLFQS